MAPRIAAEAGGNDVLRIVPATARPSVQVLRGRLKAHVTRGESKLLRVSKEHGKTAVEAEAALGGKGLEAMFGDGRHEKGPGEEDPAAPTRLQTGTDDRKAMSA